MNATAPKPPLAHTRNGVVSPLFFDRQIVRAEDLTLDRTSRDAELARMRRYLHGWGIVAGLVPSLAKDALVVSPGYGVTPAGHEIFLPAPLRVPGAVGARVEACCGDGGRDCALPAEDRREPVPGETTAWLVARAAPEEAAPRPGVPAGCRHPAMSLMPSRTCDGVAVGLTCSLPELHRPPAAACADLTRLVCGSGDGPSDPVPMPPEATVAEEYLVLGRLEVHGKGVTRLLLDDRRRLLPLSVMQDWITSCGCDHAHRVPEEPAPDKPVPDGDLKPRPDGWQEFLVLLRQKRMLERDGSIRGYPALSRIVTDETMLATLRRGRISGPEAFLRARTATLTRLTGLPAGDITAAQKELGELAVVLADGKRS